MVTVNKNVGFMAAQIAQDAPEMDEVMNRMHANVLRLAAESAATGAFMSSIRTAKVRGESGRGTRIWDRLIYSDDPGAVSIEYGHREGETHVPGKYIFSRARDATGGRR